MTTRDSHRIVSAVLVVLLSGCGQKQAAKEPPAPPPTASVPAPASEPPAVQQQRPPAESPASPAPRPVGAPSSTAATPAPARPPSVDEFTEEPALQDVFFDPGRADIGPKGARAMKVNARWIVENPGYLVLIEGHTCSSRRAWPTSACGPSATARITRCAPRRPMPARRRTGASTSA